MLILSNYFGQKYYRIPYAWKKLVAYLVIVTIIFLIHKGLTGVYENQYFSFALAAFLIFIYCKFLALVEQKEFAKLPFVGKYFMPKKLTPGA